MAAGQSSRFSRNKLLMEFDGLSLAERTLGAVPADMLDRIVVVTRFPEVRAWAEAKGFDIQWNDAPEKGISLTIRLGLQLMRDMDAVVFMVCDQPLLTRASVSASVEYFREHPDRIVSASYASLRGNPCIFPSVYFPELNALTGDTGGSAVIREHEDALLLFEFPDASELKDIDQISDIESIPGYRSTGSQK